MRSIVCGLDIGTTKVCAVIGEPIGEKIKILGFSVVQADKLITGNVVNVQRTGDAVYRAIKEAERIARVAVKEIIVGISGNQVMSLRHRNYVNITHPQREISEDDIERLKSEINVINIPADKRILHVISEDYIIDGQAGITEPVGSIGQRLEALNHVVLGSVTFLDNIKTAVERAGYRIKEMMLQPMAAGKSVLDPNETDLGVVLLDIGGECTDMAIYKDKALRATKSINIGGKDITADIRQAFTISISEAERIKKDAGYASEKLILNPNDIVVNRVGGRGTDKVSVNLLTQIINEKMVQLFTAVENFVIQNKMESLINAGVVITGGGARLRGICELSEEFFKAQTRIGLPQHIDHENSIMMDHPEYAAVFGLILEREGSPVDDFEKIEIKAIPEEKEASGEDAEKEVPVAKAVKPKTERLNKLKNSIKKIVDEFI
ncbi:MAG: cell division protein FtsA [Ignavibacteriales bacterium]|nr:cell division protein FtsA [Ignavibacteriales bacterium]MCF8306890.1 cell division protein FtsA [Ignavibacteriales bacterium]MCF8438164.1 cell division protein FtsA [Ignavibacteriales bacterium]